MTASRLSAADRAAQVNAERRAEMGDEAYDAFQADVDARIRHAVHLIACSPVSLLEGVKKGSHLDGRVVLHTSEAPEYGSAACSASCPCHRDLPIRRPR